MSSQTPRTLLLAALVAAVSACGGGGGSSPAPVQPSATPNLFLQGTISARQVGSIQVAGVTVSTAGATTRIEKAERPESELKTGMVVKVKAHRASGGSREAEGVEIEFEDAVKGKVSATDDASGTMVVGGQTVRIDDSTEFEDNAARLGSITSGQDRVRVSAVADDRGGLRATRVDKVAGASDDLEVKGVVSALGATGFTLTTGPGTVYAVTLASGVTIPAGLADGGLVEVRSAGPAVAGAIVASAISLEDRLPGQPGGETEVEGIVTSGLAASFVVNGTTVTTTAATTWNGGLPDDLLAGVKVEAEGTLGADGVLAADKVTFKASVRLFGRATGVSASTATSGRLTVNGVDVSGDLLTEWRTAATAIAENDWVEVRGSLNRAGTEVLATRLEVKSPGNARPVIQGVVSAADPVAGTVTILGQVIATDGSTELRGHSDVSGVDGSLMARADFFAAVTAGLELVKATGQNDADWTAGASGTARSLELEGER